MKRDNLVLAAGLGLVGSVITFFAAGFQAAQGLVLGAVAGIFYLSILHRDVDEVCGGGRPRTPFDMNNPWRVVRLLIPLVLVAVLALESALSVGIDSWLDSIRWEPGANFIGIVANPSMLYGALLGYVAATAAPTLGAVARNLPEARSLAKAIPGSLGVAIKLGDEASTRRPSKQPKGAVTEVPVLLISGPRGCGKSTLTQRLRQADSRFCEPEWVTTSQTEVGVDPAGGNRRTVGAAEFKRLEEAGSLAVSYRPYGEDGEQISVGLPVASVLAAASEGGACILDVDPPTARALLQYPWNEVLSGAAQGVQIELRFVTVWVSLRTVDAVMDRNREVLQANSRVSSVVERQLKPLRAQASADMEWAVTSNCFDFFVFNEDVERAAEEVSNAAKYCFKDPF